MRNLIYNTFKWVFFPVFFPMLLTFFNWKKKLIFVFCYILFFYFYLYFEYNLTFVDYSLKDFFFLLKLKGFLYFFLLLLSFLSSFPWFPLYELTFTNFLRFILVLTIYHTIFVLIFLVIPSWLFF